MVVYQSTEMHIPKIIHDDNVFSCNMASLPQQTKQRIGGRGGTRKNKGRGHLESLTLVLWQNSIPF